MNCRPVSSCILRRKASIKINSITSNNNFCYVQSTQKVKRTNGNYHFNPFLHRFDLYFSSHFIIFVASNQKKTPQSHLWLVVVATWRLSWKQDFKRQVPPTKPNVKMYLGWGGKEKKTVLLLMVAHRVVQIRHVLPAESVTVIIGVEVTWQF